MRAMIFGACGVWLCAATVWAVEPARSGAHVDVEKGGAHVDIGKTHTTTNTIARVSDLMGLRVYNSANEDVGKIEDLVVDPSTGQIRYGVLSFGGFLGMGDKFFAVPWNTLKLATKGISSVGTEKESHYVLDVNRDALKRAPGFDKNRWPDFADPNWASDIERFYGTQHASR